MVTPACLLLLAFVWVCVCLCVWVWVCTSLGCTAHNLSLSEWLQKQKDIKILFTQTQRIQFNSIHLCVWGCECRYGCIGVGVCACLWHAMLKTKNNNKSFTTVQCLLPYIIKCCLPARSSRSRSRSLSSCLLAPLRRFQHVPIPATPPPSTGQSINLTAVICGQRRKVCASCHATYEEQQQPRMATTSSELQAIKPGIGMFPALRGGIFSHKNELNIPFWDGKKNRAVTGIIIKI